MTRLALCAVSIAVFLWLGSMESALAASIGLKCQKGNVNISVTGGSCETGIGGVIRCTNSKGDSAEAVCNDGVATCGGTSGSGSCVISRRLRLPPTSQKGPQLPLRR